MAIITISRGSLSGGKALAERVSATLQLDCLSREDLVQTAAKNFGIDPGELARAVEKPPSFWERSKSSRRLYLKVARSALLDRAEDGNLVYHGHAGHLLLMDVPCVLRLRLIAPMDDRVKAAMAAQNLTPEQAIQYIEKVDKDRVRWTKYLYNVDWSDPALFDVIINLENLEMSTAVDMVVALAKSQDAALSEECLWQLHRLALTARVEAALEAKEQTRGQHISVSVEEETVHLRGRLESEELRPWVLSVVHGAPGVEKVIDDMVAPKTTSKPS